MAEITDLTFQQLVDAAGKPFVTYDPYKGDLLISAQALTGKTYEGLGITGVCEAMYQILQICANAQIAVNEQAEPGEQFTAFPPPTSGGFNPTTGTVRVTQTSLFNVQFAPSGVTGIAA
ncbi:MAG: hypothetical protein ACRC2R_25940 [Xenococcaceae cyanobacterium]